MSKVTIDESLCVGCGLCESSYPEVFKVEDDGIAKVISQSYKNHDLKEITEQCPVSAIKVE